MRKYIFISIGGALGAVLRVIIDNLHIWNYIENIHLSTLIINISGSFILALFLTVAFEMKEVDSDFRLGVSTGFFGAFTTFSTFCKETVSLIAEGKYFLAILYLSLSTMLGLAAAYFGVVLAREAINQSVRKTREDVSEINDEGEV